MLQVSGTNLTGRGLFGAAVTGEIRDGAISSDTRNSSAFPESPYESRTSAHVSQGLACSSNARSLRDTGSAVQATSSDPSQRSAQLNLGRVGSLRPRTAS
jgi:hypothetical protein